MKCNADAHSQASFSIMFVHCRRIYENIHTEMMAVNCIPITGGGTKCHIKPMRVAIVITFRNNIWSVDPRMSINKIKPLAIFTAASH